MTEYDGFSDVETRIHYWNIDFDEVKSYDFSDLCILNVAKALSCELEDLDDLENLIKFLSINYSDINQDEYPNIADQGFEYNSKLAGFIACHQFGTKFAIIPIIELSGKDAEIINSAIALIS